MAKKLQPGEVWLELIHLNVFQTVNQKITFLPKMSTLSLSIRTDPTIELFNIYEGKVINDRFFDILSQFIHIFIHLDCVN